MLARLMLTWTSFTWGSFLMTTIWSVSSTVSKVAPLLMWYARKSRRRLLGLRPVQLGMEIVIVSLVDVSLLIQWCECWKAALKSSVASSKSELAIWCALAQGKAWDFFAVFSACGSIPSMLGKSRLQHTSLRKVAESPSGIQLWSMESGAGLKAFATLHLLRLQPISSKSRATLTRCLSEVLRAWCALCLAATVARTSVGTSLRARPYAVTNSLARNVPRLVFLALPLIIQSSRSKC
mmetsp:Transcript_72309/g.133534  ORF Transcript_72309/g.133534 Transcript_72309/m.133534 type:complete len:237 (+) Transcript_72309:415-1125(+)